MNADPLGVLLALGVVVVGGPIVAAGYLATRALERVVDRWRRIPAGSDTGAPRRDPRSPAGAAHPRHREAVEP